MLVWNLEKFSKIFPMSGLGGVLTKGSPLDKSLSSLSVRVWLDKLPTPVYGEGSLLFIGLSLAFTFELSGESKRSGMKLK